MRKVKVSLSFWFPPRPWRWRPAGRPSTGSRPPCAQPAAGPRRPARIAIANPAHIFDELAETKALQIQMAEEQKKFAAPSRKRWRPSTT